MQLEWIITWTVVFISVYERRAVHVIKRAVAWHIELLANIHKLRSERMNGYSVFKIKTVAFHFCSSPLSKQGHDTGTKDRADHHESKLFVILRTFWVEQEVPCQEFDKARVDENASTGGIQDS